MPELSKEGAERQVREVGVLSDPRALLARSLLVSLKRRRGSATDARLPALGLMASGVYQNRDRLGAYAHACGFTLRDHVPATWPHVLAFPLQLELMLAPDFPFAPAGMIHISNEIELHRPIVVTERLDLRVHAAALRSHPRGVAIDLAAEAKVADELVWSELTTYLVRGEGAPTTQTQSRTARPAASLPVLAHWALPANLGRRYAVVAGDYNPIHLGKAGGRLFGFSGAIAHGMWTAAHALAALENRLPERIRMQVQFRSPVLLPSTVKFRAQEAGGVWSIGVTSGGDARTHLDGVLSPL